MIEPRILLELPCPECEGKGFVQKDETTLICSECDGSRFVELKVDLSYLKKILEGGTL